MNYIVLAQTNQTAPYQIEIIEPFFSFPDIITGLTFIVAICALYFTLTQIKQQSTSIAQAQEAIKAQMIDLKIQSLTTLLSSAHKEKDDLLQTYNEYVSKIEEMNEILTELTNNEPSYIIKNNRSLFLKYLDLYPDDKFEFEVVGPSQEFLDRIKIFVDDYKKYLNSIKIEASTYNEKHNKVIEQIDSFKQEISELTEELKKLSF